MPLYTYIVDYLIPDGPRHYSLEQFKCEAEDKEHAKEQCIDAYPNCIVVDVSLRDKAD